ncbi:MAG: tetratricopeptide repeat protein [Promethearchaeota archaeon]
MLGRKRIVLITLLCVLAVPVNSVQAVNTAKLGESGTVTYVVDGDTFDVDSVGRVRLADVDCPEMDTQAGRDAKDYVVGLCYREYVYLDIDDKYVTGYYGRYVAVAYVPYNQTHLVNLNQLLLKNGYAVVKDYDNEFSPYGWVNGPMEYIPDPASTSGSGDEPGEVPGGGNGNPPNQESDQGSHDYCPEPGSTAVIVAAIFTGIVGVVALVKAWTWRQGRIRKLEEITRNPRNPRNPRGILGRGSGGESRAFSVPGGSEPRPRKNASFPGNSIQRIPVPINGRIGASTPPRPAPGCVLVRGLPLHYTGKAVLLRLPDGREEWFPLSHTRDLGGTGAAHVFEVKRWLLEKKGIDVAVVASEREGAGPVVGVNSDPGAGRTPCSSNYYELVDAARGLNAAREFGAAVETFKRAIELDPANPVAWRGLGSVYHRARDFERAVKVKRQAVELDPANYSNWVNLGYSLRKAGRTGEAREAFTKAVALAPRRAGAWKSLAYFLKREGDDRGALYCWDRVVELGAGKGGSRIPRLRDRGVTPRKPEGVP